MRILLVEDEPRAAQMLAKGLREEAYAVDVVGNGEAATYQAAVTEYDAIILDVMLPLRDGLSVCREIRRGGSLVPILMLTARDAVEARIEGLDSGADDYLTKPYDLGELLARLRALIRRGSRPMTPAVLKAGAIELNTQARRAFVRNRPLTLTTREYALLEYLLLHANEVVGRAAIAEHVWEAPFEGMSNAIDVCIRRLRRKIDVPGEPSVIETRRGEGYMLASPVTKRSSGFRNMQQSDVAARANVRGPVIWSGVLMGRSYGWLASTPLLAVLLGAATAPVAEAEARTQPLRFDGGGHPSPIGSAVYATLFRDAAPTPGVPRLRPSTTRQQPEPHPEPQHTGFSALVRSTGSDFKSFPMRRSTWVILGVGGALSAMALPIDDEVNEELQESTAVQNFFKPGKYLGYGWVQASAAIGLYVVGRYAMEPETGSRTNKVSHLGFDLLRATILTQALTYGVKYAVQRDRPTGECCSFPSGHASVTFATAAVIERHFGYRTAWPTFLIAGYVGASRLADNRHFLSDVIFGSALGMAAGWTVVGRHGRDNFALVPAPVRGGVALTGYWTPGAHHTAGGP